MKTLIKKILREEMSVNPKKDKLKSLIFKLINNSIEGTDIYKNKGELWLIFTDEKKWVINFRESGYLYYNYIFFQDIFKYFSSDVVENQHYITEWFEDTIQNGVKYTHGNEHRGTISVEYAIQNGVKYTRASSSGAIMDVEDTIEKGIKLNKE